MTGPQDYYDDKLMFMPGPGTLDHPDVQAILHSLALSPEVQVQVPSIIPDNPPDGVRAVCDE